MEFVQRGGRGQTPNPNFFGIHFGSIEIKMWERSRAIDTYFWIQKVWPKSILSFFFFFGMPVIFCQEYIFCVNLTIAINIVKGTILPPSANLWCLLYLLYELNVFKFLLVLSFEISSCCVIISNAKEDLSQFVILEFRGATRPLILGLLSSTLFSWIGFVMDGHCDGRTCFWTERFGDRRKY